MQSATSTTATLGKWTLLLQAACLLAALIVYLVEALHPGAVQAGGVTAAEALQTIAAIAVGGGAGGGIATVGHGLRHHGTAAPTSAMLAGPPTPPSNPPDPDADLTVPA